MTLSSTQVYDNWLDILAENGIDRPTAQQILDVIVGDPRTVWEPVRTESEVDQLRNKLETAFDELDLTTFGEVDDHDALRDALLGVYDEAMDQPAEDETDATSEETDDGSSAIFREIQESSEGLAGAAQAGAGGDPNEEDITARETPLTDDEIWRGETDDEDTETTDTENRDTTSAASESDSSSGSEAERSASSTEKGNEDTDQSDVDNHEEDTEEEQLFLPAVAADVVLNNESEELENSLEPPLEIVSEELFEFGARSADVYRTLVIDALFPQYEREEAEELFESLVESRIRAKLQPTDEQHDPTAEAADTQQDSSDAMGDRSSDPRDDRPDE